MLMPFALLLVVVAAKAGEAHDAGLPMVLVGVGGRHTYQALATAPCKDGYANAVDRSIAACIR